MGGDTTPASLGPDHQPAFRFCPGCGVPAGKPSNIKSSNEESDESTTGEAPHLHWPHEKQLACRACGFTLFMNAATAVMGLLFVDSRQLASNPAKSPFYLLVAIRAHDPAKYMLDLPGGFVDPGESAEEALLRELEEEVGGLALKGTDAAADAAVVVSADDLRYLCSNPNVYHYKNIRYNPCDFSYTLDLSSKTKGTLPELKGKDDVLGLIWLGSEDLNLILAGRGSEVKARWQGHCDPNTIMEFGFPSTAKAAKLWLSSLST